MTMHSYPLPDGPRSRRSLLLLAAVIAGCVPASDADRGEVADGTAVLPFGAEVRIIRDRGRTEWEQGVVGTVGDECTTVMLPYETASGGTGFTVVPVDLVGRLQVRTETIAEEGSGAEEEGWTELDVAALRRRYGDCGPFRGVAD